MSTPDKSDAETTKRSDYPYATLQKAIEVAGAVRDLGGSNEAVQKTLIAHKLRVPEAAPSLNQNIGSAKTFGLIEGRGTYRLTERAKRFFFPTSDTEKRQAMLEMIKSPSLFESLIERFDGGKVPNAEVLANVIHRDREHTVTQSWRPRVATLFLSALRDANVVDNTGILRFKASLHGAAVGTISSMTPTIQQPIEPQQTTPETSPLTIMSVAGSDAWQFRGILLRTPEKMSTELWKKLSDYVNVLKPDTEETGE